MTRHAKSRLAALRALAPLAACSDRELLRADSLMTRVAVRAGTTLAVEGAVARECYLVQHGTIEVLRAGVATGRVQTNGRVHSPSIALA